LASSLQPSESALSDLRAELRARTERRLRLVDPSLGEEQVSALADSVSSADFVRAHLQADSEAELRASVGVIQQRQLGFRALPRQVTQQLADLFRDLHALTEMQQESVDVIEGRVAAARLAAAEGEEQIDREEEEAARPPAELARMANAIAEQRREAARPPRLGPVHARVAADQQQQVAERVAGWRAFHDLRDYRSWVGRG